jgi:hypothetical protein
MVSSFRLFQQASPTPPGATPAFLHHVHVQVVLDISNFLVFSETVSPFDWPQIHMPVRNRQAPFFAEVIFFDTLD